MSPDPVSSRAERFKCFRAALAEALKQLGYTPYDYPDRAFLSHFPLWDQALEAKFKGKGKLWGRREFDVVTKDFDSVLDIPCCFFTPELIAAYPDAQVVLNYRDPDKWLASMYATIFRVIRWRFWDLLRYTDPSLCGAWRTHTLLTWDVFCGNDYGEFCKQKFVEHYDRIRELVPKERLLEWEVRDGWGPICEFLAKEKPGADFPMINDKEELVRNHKVIMLFGVYRSFVNALRVVPPLTVVWAAVLVYRWIS